MYIKTKYVTVFVTGIGYNGDTKIVDKCPHFGRRWKKEG